MLRLALCTTMFVIASMPADPATGSWHHELTPTGEVGTSVWAGRPDAYHLAQMLLLDGRPVRGSLAAALIA